MDDAQWCSAGGVESAASAQQITQQLHGVGATNSVFTWSI